MSRHHSRAATAAAIVVTVIGGVLLQVAPASEPGDWEITDLDAGQTEFPDIALDAGGNAIAVWVGNQRIRTASFDAATQAWSPAITLSSPSDSGSDPRVAVNAAGEAVVVWNGVMPNQTTYIGLSRYSAATKAWGNPLVFPTDADWPDAVIDEHGNLTVVWAQVSEFGYCYYYYYYCDPLHQVRSARYDAATAQWSSPIALSGEGEYYLLFDSKPQIGIDPTGNVTLLWVHGAVVESRRWQSGGTSWSPVTRVSPMWAISPQMIVDRHGDVAAVWHQAGPSLYGARFSADTGTWSAGVLVASSSDGEASLGADEIGNVTVAWTASGRLYSRSYLPSTNGWAAATEIASNVVSNTGRITVDPNGNATAVWLDPNQVLNSARRPAGSGWSPGETVATFVEAPLIDSDVVGNVFLLWNSKVEPQPGLKAARRAGPLAAPGLAAPTNLRAVTVAGAAVTLAWTTPSSSVQPTGHLLEGGLSPGAVLGTLPSAGSGTVFTFPAPAGVFYLRVRATLGPIESDVSNEIVVNVGVPGPPSPPTNLLGHADGSAVALAWQNTFAGGAATGMVLDVAGQATASIPLPLTDRFTFAGVPPGTYSVKVRAVNAAGSSGSSNAITLTFPGACSPPETPTSFAAAKNGNTIVLAWSPPASGGAPTEYAVLVSGSFNGSLPTSGLTFSSAAPPGTYSLSVAATNACGTSAATPARTITIP